MTELTEYLIELAKMLEVDTDTEDCVNPNLALSARIVLAIDELRQQAKAAKIESPDRDLVAHPLTQDEQRRFKCPNDGIFEAVGYDNPVFLADTVANCPKCGEKCWVVKL